MLVCNIGLSSVLTTFPLPVLPVLVLESGLGSLELALLPFSRFREGTDCPVGGSATWCLDEAAPVLELVNEEAVLIELKGLDCLLRASGVLGLESATPKHRCWASQFEGKFL